MTWRNSRRLGPRIGCPIGPSGFADAEDVFARIRAAENGQSLADVDRFSTAWAQLGDHALVRAYATGNAAASMPRIVKPGDGVQWLTARVRADGDRVRRFTVRAAVECNRFAAQTIRQNRPGIPLIERKLEHVTTKEIVKRAMTEDGDAPVN